MNKVTLSEIAKITMGQSPKGETCNNIGEGRPLLNGPTEFGEFYPVAKQFTTEGNRLSSKGDILFCVRGSTTGRMNWSDKEYVLGRGLASIKHKKGTQLNHFLKYLIELNINSILKQTSGSTFPNLTRAMLNSFQFTIPDEIHIVRINDFLKSIDTKIELNNQINQELEAMAKLLYDYWFVQFDFPNEEGKPYKSSGGKMVYNEELKREIPEGWKVEKLSQIADTGSGATPLSTNKEYYDKGNIPWINSGEVNRPFIISTDNFITQKGFDNSSVNMFKRGTILMAMYGATAGKVSFMDIEACTNQAICAINPHEDFYRTYMKFGLEDLYQYLVNLSSGSARDNLSQTKIRDLKFIIPNDVIIKKYDKLVQPSMEKNTN